MKKLIVLLTVLVGFGTMAYSQTFFQGGVAVQDKVFKQDLKVGVQKGKNQFAAIAEFSNPTHTNGSTIYYAGLEYARYFKTNLFATGAAKIQLNSNTYGLVVEPGLGYNIRISDGLAFQPAVSFPFGEGSTIGKDVPIKAGIGLQIKF